MTCFCNNGPGNIRTAAGECFHPSVSTNSIKSRNDSFFTFRKLLRQNLVGLVCIQISFFIKKDYGCRIDKLISKIICHKNTIQILSAGSRIIRAGLFLKVFGNCLKLLIQRYFQSESVDNGIITLFDLHERNTELLACLCFRVACI